MLKITIAKDIKDNLVVLDIKPYNDNPTDKDMHEVEAAYDFLKDFDLFEDGFQNITSTITKEPSKLLFTFGLSCNYEHTECDEWLEEVSVKLKCKKCNSSNLSFTYWKYNENMNSSARTKHPNKEFVHSVEYDYFWVHRANIAHYFIRCKDCGFSIRNKSKTKYD